MVMMKKVCASVPCDEEMYHGSLYHTVSPPRSAWSSTAPTATQPITVTQRRGDQRERNSASSSVSVATPPAHSRWKCLWKMLPVHLSMG